ncbi:uncharacterized protein LOC102721508 [Oryza brachyantha]|uniref:uncharacterized protein LOC102721508 n=1 Tax=Oryza brachyantha TaxID=4533 RepID=UPI001ADBB0A8|nr:uncharacterized protein LOC102721508 [Oryza brachyantha]
MAMAAEQRSAPPPPFYNFLKEAFLLPGRNRGLFMAVFVLVAVSTSALLLASDLTVMPLAEELRLDLKALNATDPMSPDFAKLLKEIQDDTREMVVATAAYVLLSVVVGSAVRIIILFAAVATYSEERLTFGELLRKARTQLKGPLLTLAFVYVLEIASVALLAAMAGLLVFLMVRHYYVPFLLLSLLVFAGFVFLIYFSVLCAVSVAVAVAEPGRHGAGAFGRAWRLVKEKKRRAVLFVSATSLLAAVVSPVHKLAMACAPSSLVAGLLLVLVYAALMSVVELFGVCAITTFYYECKESNEVVSSDQYVRVSTEANA